MSFFHWQNGVDFIVLAVAFYLLLRWANQARALRTALAIVGLYAGSILARRFELVITSWVLQIAAAIAAVLLLVVFQTELRYALMRLEHILRFDPEPGELFKGVYKEIAEAAFRMAESRVGALIVVVRQDTVDELLNGGVSLNAEISAELLEAIFRKESPLHDGAVIIEGTRMARANTVLPLSQRRDLPLMYGTRHRAGTGMAERCDALVVVVSEERGSVTLMHDRNARPVVDEEDLISALQRLQTRPHAAPGRRLSRLFFDHAGFKLAALGLATLFWTVSWLEFGATVRTVSVAVEFSGIPRGLDISDQSTSELAVQLRGKSWLMDTLGVTKLVARFNLSSTKEGFVRLTVGPGVLNLPPGVVIERVTPGTVSVRLTKRKQ